MIQFEQGCTYDVAHLKPFDMELAKSGHPLAMLDSEYGSSVRFFSRDSADTYCFQWWDHLFNKWQFYNNHDHMMPKVLGLAPLGVKDGKPLHVGDSIEIKSQPFGRLWQSSTVDNRSDVSRDWRARDWRWPKE